MVGFWVTGNTSPAVPMLVNSCDKPSAWVWWDSCVLCGWRRTWWIHVKATHSSLGLAPGDKGPSAAPQEVQPACLPAFPSLVSGGQQTGQGCCQTHSSSCQDFKTGEKKKKRFIKPFCLTILPFWLHIYWSGGFFSGEQSVCKWWWSLGFISE